ncbi:RidA family protein [Microbacterium sp. NEAU-LLC]|uniref:RidA family protein n=1 Tax=Microbacterium helvum TaxID=2773713 RepID=A0ABR8NPX1_9MICO|nr:RidA family protein [Microbacterium helvum]MBD3942690.1 RidA family protein [Microbacterium helvum]
MIESVSSPHAPAPAGTYSSGIVSGGLLFVAGQGPFDAAGERVGESFAEQLRQTFRNVQVIAEAAGTSLEHAVRIGVYLKRIEDWAELNELSKGFLTHPYPARTTVQADLNGFDIEVDAVIALPTRA